MKKIFILLAACLFAVSAMQAQETPPPGGEPKGFKIPDREEFTLDNGLKVVLIPWGAIPKASVYITTKTGYVHEGADEVWLGRLLGRMMEEGSTNKSSEQINDELAGMGGELFFSLGRHVSLMGTDVLYEFAPEANCWQMS